MSTVLVTGGTGNTGRPLTAMLRARGVTPRIASRHPETTGDSSGGGTGRGTGALGGDSVYFDWGAVATHRAALDGVDSVYLVPPVTTIDPMPLVEPFLETAERCGVRRIVLLGSSAVPPNAPGMAELHTAVGRLPGSVVLRPSGFMQNFTGAHPLATGIRERGEIVTASGNGRLGWIDAEDIAAVAAVALLDRHLSGEHLLTGPQALSYRAAASVITGFTGRPISVVDAGADDIRRAYLAAGMPADFAAGLAGVDAGLRAGSEDRVTTTVQDLTGRPPRSFREFVRRRVREWDAVPPR